MDTVVKEVMSLLGCEENSAKRASLAILPHFSCYNFCLGYFTLRKVASI